MRTRYLMTGYAEDGSRICESTHASKRQAKLAGNKRVREPVNTHWHISTFIITRKRVGA